MKLIVTRMDCTCAQPQRFDLERVLCGMRQQQQAVLKWRWGQVTWARQQVFEGDQQVRRRHPTRPPSSLHTTARYLTTELLRPTTETAAVAAVTSDRQIRTETPTRRECNERPKFEVLDWNDCT